MIIRQFQVAVSHRNQIIRWRGKGKGNSVEGNSDGMGMHACIEVWVVHTGAVEHTVHASTTMDEMHEDE